MFSIGGNVYLNLPEQVEQNKTDIATLKTNLSNKQDASTSITTSNLEGKLEAIASLDLKHITATSIVNSGALINNGTADIEGKATFGGDVEVDGSVTLNSPTDVKFKTGSLDFSELTDFISNYYKTAGRFRYANLDITANELEVGLGVGAFVDPDSAKWLDYVQMFHNSALVDISGNALSSCSFPDFNTDWNGTYPQGAGMFDGFRNDEIILGNYKGNGYRLFEKFSGSKITIESGKSFTIMKYGLALFNACNNLVEIGAIDLSNANNLDVAFAGCYKLKSIHCTHFKVSFDISASTAFEEADLVEIIGNLDTVTTAQTLTMGATNLAKLTQDEILVATGKGWTLA